MKTYLLFILGAGLILGSCQKPAEKQLFTESVDIDQGKQLMQAYLDGDWDAYPDLYADTARIWRNKNWTKDEGFTVRQYVEDLKKGLETTSSYTIESQIWLSIISDSGDHWVYCWGIWTAHNDATNKDYEIPLHLAIRLAGNKIVQQGEFYNTLDLSLDLMKLAQEKEAVEDQ